MPAIAKVCEDCGEDYIASGGRQRFCNRCRADHKAGRRKAPAKQERRTSGRELRGSPLALDIEERVRRRLESM